MNLRDIPNQRRIIIFNLTLRRIIKVILQVSCKLLLEIAMKVLRTTVVVYITKEFIQTESFLIQFKLLLQLQQQQYPLKVDSVQQL